MIVSCEIHIVQLSKKQHLLQKRRFGLLITLDLSAALSQFLG